MDNDLIKALKGTVSIEINRGFDIRKIKGFYSGTNIFACVNYTRNTLNWFGSQKEAHQYCIEASI